MLYPGFCKPFEDMENVFKALPVQCFIMRWPGWKPCAEAIFQYRTSGCACLWKLQAKGILEQLEQDDWMHIPEGQLDK